MISLCFSSLDQAFLSSENIANFSNTTHIKGGALDNRWGFIDGTVRSCTPGENPKVFYNGHICLHEIKFYVSFNNHLWKFKLALLVVNLGQPTQPTFPFLLRFWLFPFFHVTSDNQKSSGCFK